MAFKSEINLVFGYADEAKRKFSVGPYPEMNEQAMDAVKDSVKNFNSTGLADVANLLLSDGGASCTGIVDAGVSMTSSREINLHD